MTNTTFLALQGPDGTTADLAPIVEAAQAQSGRLSVLHVGPVPLLTYSVAVTPYAVPVIPAGWLGERNRMAKHLAAKQEKTRAFLVKQELSGEVATLCVEPSAMHDLVAIRALFADISIVQNSLRDNDTAFDNIVYGLLFEAPGPVMLNVAPGSKALRPETALISWNSSVPAARAVRAALPLLKSAKEVIIASFDADPSRWADGDNPGADLATWLSHHGCKVPVQEYVTGRKAVSQAILARAAEHAADLVVMGAYGRSRWNERFFGGTTESMIKQTDIPVLLAH
jgi:nucleotide-binding universal stress UspA family protein